MALDLPEWGVVKLNDALVELDARLVEVENAPAPVAEKRGAHTKLVAAASEPASVKAQADFVCDGTSDQEEINAALNSVGVTDIQRGANGGKVILVGREFTVDGPILMQTQTELVGAYGKQATQIRNSGSHSPGSAGGMIQLATPDTQYTVIRDLLLDGQGVSVCGIHYTNGIAQEYDAFHTIDNLYVWNCGEDGIALHNNPGPRNRGDMVSRVRVINAGRFGVNANCPDAFYSMVDVGSAGSHGFNIHGTNNRFTNCKAWFSDGDGFHITGRDNELSGCESQDNEFHGFYVGGGRTSLSSCCADSNSWPNANLGDGFHVVANGFNIHGTSSDKNQSGRGLHQRYGVNFRHSGLKGIANVVTWQNLTAPSDGAAGLHASSVVNVIDMT